MEMTLGSWQIAINRVHLTQQELAKMYDSSATRWHLTYSPDSVALALHRLQTTNGNANDVRDRIGRSKYVHLKRRHTQPYKLGLHRHQEFQ